MRVLELNRGEYVLMSFPPYIVDPSKNVYMMNYLLQQLTHEKLCDRSCSWWKLVEISTDLFRKEKIRVIVS